MSLALGRRVAFTLGALLVYRIGTSIPLPGTDIIGWSRTAHLHSRGLFGMVDMPAGFVFERFGILALGVIPYVTAAILIQLTMLSSSRLRALAESGDRGRDKILAYTFCLTIILAIFQAYGIAHGLEGLRGLVPQPSVMFELTTVFSLTAGTLLLVWLSNQITARGIGNGLVLILAVGFLVDLPPAVAVAIERMRTGVVSADAIVVGAFLAVVIATFIVFVESGRRSIAVNYSKRAVGGIMVDGRSAPLSVKVNGAGMIPIVIAGWIIGITAVVSIFVAGGETAFMRQLGHGHPLFMILFSVAVVLLSLVYAAFVNDPEKASEQLKTFGGVIPGVAPGEPTADHLDNVLSRVAMVGAVYLALVFIVPEILIVYLGVPFFLGGASMLVVICAALDIGAQFKQEAKLKLGG